MGEGGAGADAGHRLNPSLAVTVVIPTFNEERHIDGCIAAVGAQTFPLDRVELLLVDGNSTDATVDRAAEAGARFAFAAVRIVRNTNSGTSSNLNRGLDEAAGGVLVRVDARSRIPPGYLTQVVDLLATRPDVGVVGGAQVAIAERHTLVDEGVARALRNRLTTGFSRYRRSARSGSADTVWMGAFRTHELRHIGGWDEALAVNEDYDLNRRYRRRGYVVWFLGGVESAYVARSGFRPVARQYLRYGQHKGRLWAQGQPMTFRHGGIMALPLALTAFVAWMHARSGARATVSCALSALIGLDVVGSPRHRPALASTTAVPASVVIAASWWIGAVQGVLVTWLRR